MPVLKRNCHSIDATPDGKARFNRNISAFQDKEALNFQITSQLFNLSSVKKFKAVPLRDYENQDLPTITKKNKEFDKTHSDKFKKFMTNNNNRSMMINDYEAIHNYNTPEKT